MSPAEKLLLEGMQRDIAAIREKVDRLAEQGGGGGWMHHAITVLVAALSGFGGGHAPTPWGH